MWGIMEKNQKGRLAMYEYKTKGTCSQKIFFDIEDGKVKNVQFLGAATAT